MAETVVKTVENVDRLFSQIVVNGEVHESENYIAPTPSQSTPQTQSSPSQSTPQTQPSPSQPASTEGEDIYAVELNNVIHNFIDRLVTQGLADETQARRSADAVIQGAINAITALIPSTASSSNKLATSSDVNVVQASLSDIQALIPSQATSQNQLADKNFVNSSIATNTANFLGTYTSLADIQAIQNPTNNDYAYLQTVDSAGNTQFQRYKYSSADSQWHYEYTLNNSSFTAEQWATINSGLTASSVSQQINQAVAGEATARDTAIANAVAGKLNTGTYTDTNLDTLTGTGFYAVRMNSQSWDYLNFPINHWGNLLVGNSGVVGNYGGNLMQMFMSDDEQLVYVRNCTASVWSSWKRVLTNDNITNQVTSGDTRAVTSDAVAEAFGTWERLVTLDNDSYIEGKTIKNDKILRLHFQGYRIDNLSFGVTITTIPENYRPSYVNRAMCIIDLFSGGTPTGRLSVDVDILANGNINILPVIQNQYSGSISGTSMLYGDSIVVIRD